MPKPSRKRRDRIVSLDTETTGLDLRHGARPFFVTGCDGVGKDPFCWEWDVDPRTRKVMVDRKDLLEIAETFGKADTMVLHNAKFDYIGIKAMYDDAGLSSVFASFWDFSKVVDTLYLGHMLASNQAHDLTSMAMVYLKVNILQYEEALEKDVKAALSAIKNGRDKAFEGWRVAKVGLPEMPSAKEKMWKHDSWVLRAVASRKKYKEGHPWWTTLSEYGNSDSVTTLHLYHRLMEEVKKRGLEKIAAHRMQLLPAVCHMEDRGLSMSTARTTSMEKKLELEIKDRGDECTAIAAEHNYDLVLPVSGNNGSLTRFVFDVLKLPVMVRSHETKAPSLNKQAMEKWEEKLDEGSEGYRFVKALQAKRKRDTAIGYLRSYKRFWLPVGKTGGSSLPDSAWRMLYPNVNVTGTDTLRFSNSNPNGQNLSKREDANLRYVFGPLPGREWWSMDAKNIELRIPAYEANERSMIDLFEREDEGPYYGSYHLLIFDILHPEKFKRYGTSVKKVYEDSWYAWVKNGNFAVLNGAVEESGTADRAYHVNGAQRKIKDRLKGVTALGKRIYDKAMVSGYVETIPDKTVDPKRGYPLLCTRTSYGRVKETVPFSYHVQGTAMWWMSKAMIRCNEFLEKRNALLGKSRRNEWAYMILQVHDQLVFDFPKGRGPSGPLKGVLPGPEYENMADVRSLQRLMEKGGEDIGVVTPVSVEYHPVSFDAGVSV